MRLRILVQLIVPMGLSKGLRSVMMKTQTMEMGATQTVLRLSLDGLVVESHRFVTSYLSL